MAKALKKKISKSKSAIKPILYTKNLPATQEMLDQTTKQLLGKIGQVDKKMESQFKLVDARFNQVDARFNQVDAKFNKLESIIMNLTSEVHRMAVLMEEQNSRNKFVLDGYASLHDKLAAHENHTDEKLKDLEKLVLKKISEV